MNIVGIIPARMGSSRFPGKPLARIHGIPMIEHVYKRSQMARSLTDLYVATCDEEIKKAVNDFDGKVIMTKDTHERASDRTAEAVVKIENQQKIIIDLVVMIQGDEPMIYPEMIDSAVSPFLSDKSIMVVNLMAELKTSKEHQDPNEIKVVVDKNNFAMYFSREPIPFCRKGTASAPRLKQVCVIPFRRDFLVEFNNLAQTPLEISESVDMLRILENGYKVKMVFSEHQTYSVDTTEDLKKVECLMGRDPLIREYLVRGKMTREQA